MGLLGDVLGSPSALAGEYRVKAANGPVDFAQYDVAVLPVEDLGASLACQPLWEERLVAVCASRSLDVSVAGEAFPGMRLVSYPEAPWRNWLTKAGIDPARVRSDEIEVDDSATAIGLALAGQGLALADEVNFRSWLEGGVLVAPFEASLATGRRVAVVWPRNTAERPSVHRFADWLKAEYAMGSWG